MCYSPRPPYRIAKPDSKRGIDWVGVIITGGGAALLALFWTVVL
jgi:hypothetical protein